MYPSFETILKQMIDMQASDLFVTVGVPLSVKKNDEVVNLNQEIISSEKAHEIIISLMTEEQQKEFLIKKEYNFAIFVKELGRFRVSAFQQRLMTGAVLRRIQAKIPTLEELNVPTILNKIAMTVRGLILVVGATGSGKSSTLAAMLGYRNENSKGHIITVEDPIEYIHEHKGCIVTQREVGTDTASYEIALRNALRQAPNVILIGEIRSVETMKYALAFSETGHLCLATMHANNANQAFDRIAHFFPQNQQAQLWMDLSMNLRAVIGQQLLPTKDGKGQVAATEILLNTPLISDKIRKGEIDELKSFMGKSREQGMQTFDQALFELYSNGKISYDTALKYADSENEVRLMIKLSRNEKLGPDIDSISLKPDS
ncbi:MAG: twitching motility protein PilU [Francisellaceae bacterium]|nr:twitching motility protein PilU [Francisellaceae bacterium]